MSARASYAKVSNWPTTKFKGSHTSSKLNAAVPHRHYYSVSPRSARHPPSGGVNAYKRYRLLPWRSVGCKNQRVRRLTGEG